MSNKLSTAINHGLKGQLIEVEADTAPGLPNFIIVGLADTAIQESKERVKLAIKNSGYKFPPQRVIVNLAPADFPKNSSSLDLPIALAILGCYQKQIIQSAADQYIALGELSLDGQLKPIKGCLNLICFLNSQGWNKYLIPKANLSEARLSGQGTFYPINSLNEAVCHLNKKAIITGIEPELPQLQFSKPPATTYSLIRGQEQAKRASIISAAGGHNLLMIGPPGSGKTLMAKHLTEILPPLTLEESLEVTKIYSLVQNLPENQPLITNRPFRAPHHGASEVALIGGGQNSKPGEVTLAHRGILFLDELPEFSRRALESLRQPLEDGQITISRAKNCFTYPARLTLIAAANPCPCGYSGDQEKKCLCTILHKQNYLKKISGPLLDRIDLAIYLRRVKTAELLDQKNNNVDIDMIQKQVKNARNIQQERFSNNQGLQIFTNAEMSLSQVNKYCQINPASQKIVQQAIDKYKLSARAYHRLLKVARTIADLENSENIQENHLTEAIQYRLN